MRRTRPQIGIKTILEIQGETQDSVIIIIHSYELIVFTINSNYRNRITGRINSMQNSFI